LLLHLFFWRNYLYRFISAMYAKPLVLDRVQMRRNEIKDAILNNDLVDDTLHVIAVLSNPCQYKKRVSLMRDFVRRMEFENNVAIYVVELAYGDQPFSVTSPDSPKHLQVRAPSDAVLWHKENLINMGVRHLLPPSWKAFAWIDSDIDFESTTWATDTLRILHGCRDVVQLFSHALDMDANEEVMNIFNSFAFKYERDMPYSHKPNNYWHPGYAWACTRRAYERMGGLFQLGVLGSGDHIMTFCFMNRGLQSVSTDMQPEYKDAISLFQRRVKRLRLGYVPGVIRHFFHGSKANRHYKERNHILIQHKWQPSMVFPRESDGLLLPRSSFSFAFRQDILDYFSERKEDE